MPISSTSHFNLTIILGLIVTALACFTLYMFRTGMLREQIITDCLKASKASAEATVQIAEKGLPSVRTKLEELEMHGRMLEQAQRATLAQIRQGPALASPAIANDKTEAEMLAARRAARS